MIKVGARVACSFIETDNKSDKQTILKIFNNTTSDNL